MAPKPQARSPAKQAEKAKEKPQRERFIEVAHAVGVDETGKKFERLFKKVLPQNGHKSSGQNFGQCLSFDYA